MPSVSLPIDALRRIEVDFARCTERPKYWRNVELPVNALGRLLDALWSRRRTLARNNPTLRGPSQTDVAEGLGLNARGLSEFLNGHLKEDGDWVAVAKGILKLILLGKDVPPNPDQLEVFERIEMLFFHYAQSGSDKRPNKRWYFDPTLRDSMVPETSIEGAQEVRAMAAMCGGFLGSTYTGRIVRCSGERGFAVSDAKGEPLFATMAMISALIAGVHVHFVYPCGTKSEAERTAGEFQSLAAKGAGLDLSHPLIANVLRPVDPDGRVECKGRIVRAGQWLGPSSFIYVYHTCHPTGRSRAGTRGWSRLMVSRDPRRGHGPSAFATDEEERQEFEQWLDLFAPMPIAENDPSARARSATAKTLS